MTPQQIAEASAAAMWAGDAASRAMGMRIDAVGPGTATLSMTLAPDHLNGHGTAHGGVLFTLADSAFAFACNSHGDKAVAASAQVAFLAPGKGGERVTARAAERTRAGRSGICDVTVTGEDGRVLAEFRGLSRTVPGSHLEET